MCYVITNLYAMCQKIGLRMLLRKQNIQPISSSCLYVDAIYYVLLLSSSVNMENVLQVRTLELRDKQEVKESILSTKTRWIIFQEYYSKKEEVIDRTQLLNMFHLLLALHD